MLIVLLFVSTAAGPLASGYFCLCFNPPKNSFSCQLVLFLHFSWLSTETAEFLWLTPEPLVDKWEFYWTLAVHLFRLLVLLLVNLISTELSSQVQIVRNLLQHYGIKNEDVQV